MNQISYSDFTLHDCEPGVDSFQTALCDGLTRSPKTVPCKYLYDKEGSLLFEEICVLPEYYPTRTELRILQQHARDIARFTGSGALVVELGSGASVKTKLILDALPSPAAYVPVEISKRQLVHASHQLHEAYPDLEIIPVCADYTDPFPLPFATRKADKVLFFFPGSTIGNFHPDEAIHFMRHLRRLTSLPAALVIGVDLQKQRQELEAAYNDSQGVTAAFNLNLLRRANRELGTGFDLDAFQHRAIYNERHARIEMHLMSRWKQTVTINHTRVTFQPQETILTECSYKHRVDGFVQMAENAGYRASELWQDENRRFAVFYLESR